MNYGLLFRDIFTLNLKSLKLRARRLNAVIRRKYSGESAAVTDPKNIPVIINNYNRLSYLLQLITWLENAGMRNITILDNDSSYPPLLKFYETTKHRVVRLGANLGHLALWKSPVYNEICNRYYIYTDSDVVPSEICPADVFEVLLRELEKYPAIEKIGLGLKIDDLPDHYSAKQKVIGWESKYWQKPVSGFVYHAEVDTTLALYRPFTDGSKWVAPAFRTGIPYVARHLPWYENSANPGEESEYYAAHVRQGASHWIPKKN
jgi:hypothetical protein